MREPKAWWLLEQDTTARESPSGTLSSNQVTVSQGPNNMFEGSCYQLVHSTNI